VESNATGQHLTAARLLLGYGGQFSHDREFTVLNWRRKHQACDWITVRQQSFDKSLEVRHARGGHLEQEIVTS
jgi:hypothetical protein